MFGCPSTKASIVIHSMAGVASFSRWASLDSQKLRANAGGRVVDFMRSGGVHGLQEPALRERSRAIVATVAWLLRGTVIVRLGRTIQYAAASRIILRRLGNT